MANFRILHRFVSYVAVLPLSLTLVTGFLYKLLDSMGVNHEKISFLMAIHQMSFLFPNSSVFYTFILFTLVLLLVFFGFRLVNYGFVFNTNGQGDSIDDIDELIGNGDLQSDPNASPYYRNVKKLLSSVDPSKVSVRDFHHRLGSFVFLVMLLMATTGFTYRLLRTAGMEKSKVKWIIKIHSMEFLPWWLSLIWITLVFILIISMIISGMKMIYRKIRYNNNNDDNGNINSTVSSISIDNDEDEDDDMDINSPSSTKRRRATQYQPLIDNSNTLTIHTPLDTAKNNNEDNDIVGDE